MRKSPLFAAALLALLCGFARAQAPAAADDDSDEEQDSGSLHVTPKDKFVFGNQGYRSNDASVSVDLPRGFGVNADYSFYRTKTSLTTPSFSLGASAGGERWDASTSYSWTPLKSNAKSHTFDVDASIRLGSRDFRTTLGAAGSVTDNFQYISGAGKKRSAVEITQRRGTLSLKQRFFGDTSVSADLSGYNYNHNIEDYSLRLAQAEAVIQMQHPRVFNGISASVNNLNGLLSGFPAWSAKFGINQDLDALPIPVTVWGNYENIRYLPAYTFAPPSLPINSLVSGVTSDSYTFGADAEVIEDLTASFQYNHVRQTGQIVQDLYGFSLEKRF